jgi:hypothetical protein
VTRAVQARASAREVLSLIRLMFSEGEPDVRSLAMIASVLVLPPTLRSKLRDQLRMKRR